MAGERWSTLIVLCISEPTKSFKYLLVYHDYNNPMETFSKEKATNQLCLVSWENNKGMWEKISTDPLRHGTFIVCCTVCIYVSGLCWMGDLAQYLVLQDICLPWIWLLDIRSQSTYFLCNHCQGSGHAHCNNNPSFNFV